ncbi:uncharacterized protein PHACADRAFT_69946, partial [Phanerochaete carnosa HHB-10118-sp]
LARWARLRLPNGQTARSAWTETSKDMNEVRMSRMVKLDLDSKTEFAEIQYYFLMRTPSSEIPQGFAMASVYGPPDQELLKQSHNTVWSCQYRGTDGLRVIDTRTIQSVVAIVP